MFHDGRVELDPTSPTGFRSPAGDLLPSGLDNVLAVQAMFPATSAIEMAGQPGENSIANAASEGRLAGPDGVWDLLAQRLRSIPEYVEMFTQVFPGVTKASEITFVHAANAIAGYQAAAWRSDNSPFDRFLRGEPGALSPTAVAGMRVFYGKGRCSSCHAGTLQTDHSFHAICLPQIGPGKGDGPDGRDDFGRERVTGDPADRYRFRTPSLRNVALTGPWGHDGAFDNLGWMVFHHLVPFWMLALYDPGQAVLPPRADLDTTDRIVFDDLERRVGLLANNELPQVRIEAWEFMAVLEFLRALTDPMTADLRRDVPRSVPSGLPVFD
jgi:cytochrome c peroxidase